MSLNAHYRFALILAVALMAGAAGLRAGPVNESIVGRLSGMERLQLGKLQALDQSVLAEIPQRVDPQRLRERTDELLALSVPAIGSRVIHDTGQAAIHDYLRETFAALEPHGLEVLGSFRSEIAAPVSLDRLADAELREAPARVVSGGETIHVHPLWPNGPMPSLAPREGLRGPLVHVGDAAWSQLNGKPLDGAIALMDFRGGGNLERLFSLGAAAVVVLADNHIQYQNAIKLFSQTPFPFPRYYADAGARERLLELVRDTAEPPMVELHGGQVYEDRTVESLLVRIPAPATSPFTVTDAFMLEWVAAVNGLGVAEVRAANAGLQAFSAPGTVLRIPGGRPFTVPADGMWEMVARLHDITSDELRAANPGIAAEPLTAGTQLAIPAARLPLVLMAPIDTASVAPDAPHGARAMANLAASLELLDFLATHSGLRLRRDVIFAFLDGDTLGGQASRLIAEYTYLLQNRFARATTGGGGPGSAVERYRAAAEWFANGSVPQDPLTQRWLLNDWLIPRFEEKRIQVAEDRILRLTNARGSERLPGLEELEERLVRVARLRDDTVMSAGGDAERLSALYQAWDGGQAGAFAEFGLDRGTLQRRLSRELAHEERSLANHDHNLAAARSLRDAIVKRPQDERRLALGWRIALGDGSPYLGIHSSNNHLRSWDARAADGFRARFRKLAAYAASRAGWPEDYNFIALEDAASLPLQETPVPVHYQDFWFSANVHAMPLGGQSDRLEKVDTPRDVPERFDWVNFSRQARTLFVVATTSLESLLDSEFSDNKRERELSRITGSTVQFNIRSGIDARDPVPGTYVFLPMSNAGAFLEVNTDAWYGHRRGIVQRSLLSGAFNMPVAAASFNNEPRVYAYHLDRDMALFTKVATEGQVGTKAQDPKFKYRPKEAVEKNLVMIDVYPRVIFAGTNPSTLDPVLGGAYASHNLELSDAVINGTPRDFAVDNPLVDFRERERDGLVLYLPEGTRARAAVRTGMDYNMLLAGPVRIEDDGKARGQGIRIGPADAGDGRNLLLPLTSHAIATGMWELGQHRLDLYASYGISSRPLQAAVDRAGELIAEADAAIGRQQWQSAIGKSREAWGIMVKAFPRILKLGREAVFSVILLMALAVPGAVFLERLIIGSKSIIARLTGTTILFILATLFLNIFHPAFKISLSPFIIVIAFTMILMSVIVLALSYARFDVVLRKFRSAGGEVHSEEISFMSSLSTAFSLGVSNLKKRAFRTALTVFTVTALTFSIVGFVAVSGSDALRRLALPLDTNVEGQRVDPLPPAYDGFLIRSFNWLGTSESKVAAVQAEFGAAYDVTVRAHYIEAEGGNNANREGVNQIPVSLDGRRDILTGIMAFQPNEPRFSGLHRAVSGEVWFSDGADGRQADRFSVILPDQTAAELGIGPEDLLDSAGRLRPPEQLPQVRMANSNWRVIGILDTGLANRIRDVNGRSLAMVDYLRSGMSSGISGANQIVSEGQSYHFDWKRLAIVPFDARHDVGAQVRSVAVRIPQDKDPAPLFADLTLRLKNEFFAASDGEVSLIIPRQQVDLAGVAKILLPVLLCVLIVMNTMLGTVEERKGEVGMLGAIGLSPRQIAFLMFAESTVFSILGILLGTFGGLMFANIVNSINAAGGNFLTSLSFNFTSLISMVLATGTGVVVLLATLIPANKAAAVAAPSGMTEWVLPESEVEGEIRFKLPFTLTRGNAVGMTAFFHQFLVNHNEPTSDDFNCREVLLAMERANGQPVIQIGTDMWLAPYDLDVAQHFNLTLQEGGREGVYEVELFMQRFSGSEENGRRTAYNLLNLVRRQFLLWRNLEPSRRAEFIQQGARLLERSAATPAIT
jgi:hypothetical protein